MRRMMMLIGFSIIFAVFYIEGLASAAEVNTIEIEYADGSNTYTAVTHINGLKVIRYEWGIDGPEVIEYGVYDLHFAPGTFNELFDGVGYNRKFASGAGTALHDIMSGSGITNIYCPGINRPQDTTNWLVFATTQELTRRPTMRLIDSRDGWQFQEFRVPEEWHLTYAIFSPVGTPVDLDGDGVPVYKDICLDTPVGVSVDSDGCPVSQDSDGDGISDDDDNCINDPNPDQADSDGDGVGDVCDLPLMNPTALFEYSPDKPKVGEEIIFDASGSFDTDGEISLYEWDFGDGNVSQGLVVNHTYSTITNGYNVTLTVTDNNQLTDSFSQEICLCSSDDPLFFANSVQVTDAFSPTMIAFFTPENQCSLDEVAQAFGYDHFNWVSIITALPFDLQVTLRIHYGENANTPFFDPVSGGGDFFFGAWADNLDFYWDESTQDGTGTIELDDWIGSLPGNRPNTSLKFQDTPNDPTLNYFINRYIKFQTSLVGIYPNGSYDHLFVFSWKTNYNGETGGVSRFRNTEDPIEGSGTGGIFDVELNINLEEIPLAVRQFMVFSGALNVPLPQAVDLDNDDVIDDIDNCFSLYNPYQLDSDSDFVGDLCDNCSEIPNPEQSDIDLDGIGDACDNCPDVANDEQANNDNDALGDACDPDIDNDGVLNDSDECDFTENGVIVDSSTGCSIAQLCPCEGPMGTTESWKNQGKYVSCVAKTSENFVEQDLITEESKDAIVSDAAQSDCGDKE